VIDSNPSQKVKTMMDDPKDSEAKEFMSKVLG
jgi:hypothetical protein